MDTEPTTGGVSGWLENNPTLALGGVIILVLLLGATLLKHNASGPATTPATGQDLSGLSTDSNGNPIVYVPTQTVFSTYNATDASQTVSNTGPGNVTTGSSSAGNTTQPPTLSHPVAPPRKPPVQGPEKVSLQWNQNYSTMGQSLDMVASNATTAMNADAGRLHIATRFAITGQQIYNQNKVAVDSYFALHHIKSNVLSTPTTGLAIHLAHLVKQ